MNDPEYVRIIDEMETDGDDREEDDIEMLLQQWEDEL